MTNRTSSLKLLLLAAGLVSFASGCAEERDPINRVQANALKKSFFVGAKLADGADDPEFYSAQTVIDVPYGADGPLGTFTGLLGDMKRVKWEITEDTLNGRLSYEEIAGVDRHGSRVTNNGRVIASYRIGSHFDIKRSYNPSTGEELNVVEENQSDRPWYQREYMRVDWSTNLINASYWDPLDSAVGSGSKLNAEPLSYYVSDPNHPDAPVFVPEEGYFDFVNRYYLSPKTIVINDVEQAACNYRGSVVLGASYPWGNCESSEISVRASFRRVPQPGDAEFTDYEPIDYDGSRMNAFGMFWVNRLGWDNHYGVVDDQWYHFGQRHNIWKASHAKDPAGKYYECAKPIDVANAVNSNRDEDGNGTEDECADAGVGSRCDTLAGQCTIPYAKREVRPIVWRYTVNGQDAVYLESTQFATWEWDTAMRIAVQAARRVECNKTSGASLDGTKWQGQACESAFPIRQRDDAEFEEVQKVMRCWGEKGWGNTSCYSDNGIVENDIAGQTPVVILCQNPVTDQDPSICGKTGYTVRSGDIRYHHVSVWPTRQNSSPWGYGPSLSDPLTGEILSVGINVYAAVTDQAAQSFLDTMRWVNGELSSDQISTGSYVRGWTRANQSAEGSPAAWPSMTREEADRRVQSLGGLTPERLANASLSGKLVSASQLADLDRRLYDEHVIATDMPGRSINVKADARLNMIKGTPIEAELMNPMWLELAGINGQTPLNESILERASPIRDLHPRNIIAREQEYEIALARKGQCMLEAPEPTGLPAFAKVMAMKFPAENYESTDKGAAERTKAMWDFLRYKMHYSVILHEMGHTFGETHNFVGSYDKFNYRPQYWQLRTKSGEVTRACTGAAAENPSNCIGPRYFDPLDQEEADQSIWTWMHTTVMDYPGDLTHDTLGLGVYDYAAARFFYGDTVDVRNDGKFPTAEFDGVADVPNTGTTEGNAIRSLVDYAGYLFGQTFSITQGGRTRNPHHTEMQNLFQMLWDCEAVNPVEPAGWDREKFGVWDAVFDGHIVRNEVCSRAPVDYVGWNQLLGDRRAVADDPKFFIPRRARMADGRVRMPYGMQLDWHADSGYPSANRHDNGADMYEEIVFHTSLYENRHIFDNFRNFKSTFNIYGAYSRALSRYHAKIGVLTGGFAYTVGFILEKFGSDLGINWDDVVAGNIAPNTFLYDHTVAASAGLDHFARVMTRPQPGLHFRYGPADPIAHSEKDLFLNVRGDQQQIVVTLPNGSSITEDGSLALGARPIQNEFNYANGAWNSDYLNQVGSYYEKVLVPNLMLQADTFSLNFYRFDALDTRMRFVNLTHLWPNGFRQMVGMMLTDDVETYAPRLALRSDGSPDVVPSNDPNDPNSEYPAKPLGWVSWVGNSPQVCWTNASKMNCSDALGGALGPNPNLRSLPIEPQWAYEEQKFLLLWLYTYQPDNEVWDWVDMMRIYRTGKDIDPAYLPSARIEHLDLESGLRYIAKRYGDEQIFGKTYDKGVAAKMIGWANTLAGLAFQLDPTTPFDPVTGSPNYVLDAAGKPVVKPDPFVAPSNVNAIRCDENRYCKQLRKYRGLLDFARDMAARVGFPEPALQIFQ